jgi:hypothetical protein
MRAHIARIDRDVEAEEHISWTNLPSISRSQSKKKNGGDR